MLILTAGIPGSPTEEILRVDFDGPGDNRIDETAITSVSLAGGISATTAAQLVTALNNTSVSRSASLSGNPNTQVALSPILPFDVTLDGALAHAGYTTGLAFGTDESTLYGITDQGQFLVDIRQVGSGAARKRRSRSRFPIRRIRACCCRAPT